MLYEPKSNNILVHFIFDVVKEMRHQFSIFNFFLGLIGLGSLLIQNSQKHFGPCKQITSKKVKS